MLQPKEKNEYLIFFYEHQPGEILIINEAMDITIKDKKINGKTITAEKQFAKLNLGSEEEPQDVLLTRFYQLHFNIKSKTC
jgi:hypothetical protein